MASEITYTFFTNDPRVKGQLKGACIGKKTVYDGFKDFIEVYSLNYNSFHVIAIWRLKYWKPKVSTNTLNNDTQSIAA